MKKSHFFFLLDLFIGIVFLSLSFIRYYLSYYRLLIFLLLFLFLFSYQFGFSKNNRRYIYEFIIIVFFFYFFYFSLLFLIGLFLGFQRVLISTSFSFFREYIFPMILIIILREILRYQVSSFSDSFSLMAFSFFFFFLLDLVIPLHYANTSSREAIFYFIAIRVFPSLSYQILSFSLTKKVGYYPLIVYSLFFLFYENYFPVLPLLKSFFFSLFHFLLPFLFLFISSIYFSYQERKLSFYPLPLYFPLFFFLLIFSGYFRYYFLVVGSGSMEPVFSRGDVVLLDQKKSSYQVGDIVAFCNHQIIVIHRIHSIAPCSSSICFQTKGDANSSIDASLISQDDIIGKVVFSIPYIGYPTLWIHS